MRAPVDMTLRLFLLKPINTKRSSESEDVFTGLLKRNAAFNKHASVMSFIIFFSAINSAILRKDICLTWTDLV